MSKITKAVETYQCPGCVVGSNTKCGKFKQAAESWRCVNHCAGTRMSGAGRFFLGMPNGFNRLGNDDKTAIYIFPMFSAWGGYDKFNVPVWKFVNESGHTLVRMYQPRLNAGWIQVFLEDCAAQIDCLELTGEDVSLMD